MGVAQAVARVARGLRQTGYKVVFAESCTGGLVSGALTRVPGISAYHCGGVVVYRTETKRAYLQVPVRLLARSGPVSAEVSEFMAASVLKKTPEADVAVAVTGHLGPDAPAALDGHVYIAVAWRHAEPKTRQPKARLVRCGKADSRVVRQRFAVAEALRILAEELESRP